MFDLKFATTIVPNRGQNGENVHKNSIIGPERTYNYAPTRVLHHHLELKLGVSVMVTRNILHHPHLLHGKMLIVPDICAD